MTALTNAQTDSRPLATGSRATQRTIPGDPDRLPGRRLLPPMNTDVDAHLPAHQPLSSDEVARAVDRLGMDTLELPGPPPAVPPAHYVGELRRMTAKQRFWLAFAGRPGSSGRAGPAYEPGLPRGAPRTDDAPFGIPRQRRAAE